MLSYTVTCDVCNSVVDETKDVKEVTLKYSKKTIQVIGTTEQNEGRSVAPYLTLAKLDLCNACEVRILEGNYLYMEGAMGCNKYFFKAVPV